MIERIDMNGVHTDIDEKLEVYITKKIGRLDRFVPRDLRASVHAEVFIKLSKPKDKRQHTCEVVLHLPKEVVACSESTVNVYAAVDIVEAKLKNKLKKYKEIHGGAKKRHILHRLRSKMAR